MHDTMLHTGVLVKLTPNYLFSTQLRPTCLIRIQVGSQITRLRWKLITMAIFFFMLNANYSKYPTPTINAWQNPDDGYIIAKINANLSKYIFTTGLGGSAELSDIAVDLDDNIIVAGSTWADNPIELKNPMSSGPRVSFLVKFPPNGGEPLFATRLPWPITGLTDEGGSVFPLSCGDICVGSFAGRLPLPELVNSLDTSYGNSVYFTIDPSGQNVVSLGYWHLDEKYTKGERSHLQGYILQNGGVVNTGGTFTRNGNLTTLSSVLLRSSDSVSTLRAFQSKYAGGENDMFLYRTRLPGCEMLSCSVSMADSVRITHTPPRVDPVQMTVTADVLNIHPTLLAGEVECVLSLPPDLSSILQRSLFVKRLHRDNWLPVQASSSHGP